MRESDMNEYVNSGRQFEVDCVKFFAIFYMVCIHVYEQYGSFDFYHRMPDSVFRNMMEFLGGPLAAPVFMFCMGIGMVYTRHRSDKDFIRRGWKLLLTGYCLNFFRQTLLQLIGMIIGVETDLDIIGGLLNVDILQFAGMSFLTIGIMKKGKLSARTMCVIAVLMQAVGIWGTKLSIKSVAIQDIVGLILPTGKWVAFPLTLWMVYPVLGLYFGERLQTNMDKKKMYHKLITAFGSLFVAYTVCLIYNGYDIRSFYALNNDFYYHQIFLSTLWILPIIICMLGICYYLFKSIECTKFGSFIRYCSTNLNTIYIIQWLIIAYGVAFSILLGIDKTESAFVIISGGIVVLMMAIGITVLYKKVRKKRAN